jgi:hypothetical protein
VYLSACSGIYKSENAGALFHKIQGILPRRGARASSCRILKIFRWSTPEPPRASTKL